MADEEKKEDKKTSEEKEEDKEEKKESSDESSEKKSADRLRHYEGLVEKAVTLAEKAAAERDEVLKALHQRDAMLKSVFTDLKRRGIAIKAVPPAQGTESGNLGSADNAEMGKAPNTPSPQASTKGSAGGFTLGTEGSFTKKSLDEFFGKAEEKIQKAVEDKLKVQAEEIKKAQEELVKKTIPEAVLAMTPYPAGFTQEQMSYHKNPRLAVEKAIEFDRKQTGPGADGWIPPSQDQSYETFRFIDKMFNGGS